MADQFLILDRTFQDIESYYTLDEIKEKARLFYRAVRDFGLILRLQDDYWVQMSRQFDVNYWLEDRTFKFAIYRMKNDSETDTETTVYCESLDTVTEEWYNGRKERKND